MGTSGRAAAAAATAGAAEAAGPRIVVRRGPADHLRVKEVDFGALWGLLQAELLRAFGDPVRGPQPPRVDPTKLHDATYKLCTCPCRNLPRDSGATEGEPAPHVVYAKIRELLELHTLKVCERRERKDGVELLRWYHDSWKRYRTGVDFTAGVCSYVDRDWVQQKVASTIPLTAQRTPARAVFEIRTLGLVVWREKLLIANAAVRPITQAVCDEIDNDRRRHNGAPGPLMDRSLIQGVLQSFMAAGVDHRKPKAYYIEWFEARLTRSSDVYFKREMKAKIGDGSVDKLPAYMEYVEKRIREEIQRARDCLDPGTERPIVRTLVKIAIEDHAEALLNASPKWFADGRVEEQRRLFQLLRRFEGGLEPLRKLLEDKIDSDGKAAVVRVRGEVQSNPAAYVDALVSVQERYQGVVRDVFDGHEQFELALCVGCQRFINRNALSPTSGAASAQLLARYAHFMLRPGTTAAKARSEGEVDSALNRCVALVRHLEDKDVFQRYYMTMLSKRLIQNTYDEALDEEMIRKLKTVCGREFTHKLERMFTDVGLSRDLTRDYAEYCEKNSLPTQPDLTVHVGTSGTWPLTTARAVLALPEPLHSLRERFQQFYHSTHTGRKLFWHYGLSTVITRTHYPLPKGRSYELHVSVHQMATLLCFSSPEVRTLSWAALSEQTKLEDADLEFALQTLCKATADRKGLLTTGQGEKETEALRRRCDISINPDFIAPKCKVLLNTQPRDAGTTEDKETMKAVSDDRRFTIQAAIMRIMKAKQHVSHQILMVEVTSLLTPKFAPTPYDIKKNVDRLLEKEHIERGTDGSSYVYKA